MKKTILIMSIALAAMISSAASIKWSVGNGTIKNLDGTANVSGADLYFFIGTASDSDVLAAFSKVGSDWVFDSDKLISASTPLLATGSSNGGGGKPVGADVYFDALISETTATDFFCIVVIDGYYQLGTYSSKGYDAGNVASSPTTAAFTSGDFGGWQKVPEPATAALALAGLALLIRRRK